MTAPPVIESDRLRMRPLAVGDAEALYAIYGDVEAMTWWSHAPHVSVDQTRDQLASYIAQPDWRAWAITLKGDPSAIGSLAAHEKRQGKVVEIGYSLVRSRWGNGYAREAVSALITHLFRAEGMRRVFADTDPDNTASNHLLERLGFIREGRLRAEWETHLGVRDSLIWGLLAGEWRT